MRTAVKLAGYGGVLAVVFAGAAGVGAVADPGSAPAPKHGHSSGHGGHMMAELPKGLQISQDGYTLVPDATVLSRPAQQYAFHIAGPDGTPVTRYTTTHDKDLHLIVVRRDMSGFQHVHPVMAPDGRWTTPLRLGAGDYRVLADFQPAGRDEALTLGADLSISGHYQPRPLPPPSTVATVDGYTVRLNGRLVPGTASKLTLTVAKDGKPVTDLQPYLAAYGHLVALRHGDLAYLHVHPEETTKPGPDITFYAEVPTAGMYRLYLDFKHRDVVRTAEFTATAQGDGGHGGH
jgi:hypothetical protein